MVRLTETWKKYRFQILLALFIGIAVVASLQDLFHAPKTYSSDGRLYTEYNNYVIFKFSAIHLVQGRDLYQWFPNDHWDLYKYSPAFALFFSVFAYFPDAIGLILWSLLNSLIVFFAISKLPGFSDQKKSAMLLFCLIELLGSIQNTQSNGLMAGLMILAFLFLEKSNYFLAAFCIVFSVYIKIFGAVAFALYLFYPNKLKLAAYTLFWMLFMALVPAVVTGIGPLMNLYTSWFHLLKEDHLASQGLSLVGLLNSWFAINVSKNLVALAGVILFCLPLMRISQYPRWEFRVLVLASILLWTIVFNHKAESPTFIISMCGIALWYFCKERGRLDTLLLVFSFVLTTLSVSDLCPRFIREEFVKPYGIKGLMSIIIWFKIIFELLFIEGKNKITQGRISIETPSR